MATSPTNSKVAVVVASCGRPREVAQLFRALSLQTLAASDLILSVHSEADVPDDLPPGVRIIEGPRGSSGQRNRGLDAVAEGNDVVAFFDDDYLPSNRAIEGISRLFGTYRDIAGANGWLLADGINSPEISLQHAVNMLEEYDRNVEQQPVITSESWGLYGCNMVFRFEAIRAERFDENLPLYGWQEDNDFAARIGRVGRLVQTRAFAGVHRGVKGARGPGVALGYSQIANPLYLVRKGTMSRRNAYGLLVRNLLANVWRTPFPEPWVDRWGRLCGNLMAIADLTRGKCDPRRIAAIADRGRVDNGSRGDDAGGQERK